MDTGRRRILPLGNNGKKSLISWEIKKNMFGFPKVAYRAALGAGFESCSLANVITACGIVLFISDYYYCKFYSLLQM